MDVAQSINQNRATQARFSNADLQCEPLQHVVNGELKTTIVLATMLVRPQVGTQLTSTCRTLLDSGAQLNIMTRRCATELGLRTQNCRQFIHGIAGESVMNEKVILHLHPHFNNEISLRVEMFIINDIEGLYPSGRLAVGLPAGIKLADPTFMTPGPIQMLLGADVYARLVMPKILEHTDGGIVQQTHFGFIILGRFLLANNVMQCAVFACNEGNIAEKDRELHEILQRFWQIEEAEPKRHIRSPDEQAVEQIFLDTHYRTRDGRFVVQMPIKAGGLPIADSRNIVLRRFHQLERKLQADHELREKYVKFMKEYESLGHMKIADRKPVAGRTVYIPHHAVRRKFRVVFDASCKNIAGVSLNDIQLVGEKLQFDLQDQLMRFRRGKIAVMADINKMYRQFRIDESQWDLQRIFWRETPYEPIREYWLTTVTYGIASSGHCAVRAMIQCAKEAKISRPAAADAVLRCFYMDDALLNADSIAEAKRLAKDVHDLLAEAGMDLCHWVSNDKSVQFSLNTPSSAVNIDIGDEHETKVLGLRWLTTTDEFAIIVKAEELMQGNSKRQLLSGIGKLYDPNGFVSPVVITAKIIMQDLWRSSAQGWDNPVSHSIKMRWVEFVSDIKNLNHFRIPRWLATSALTTVQVHGFCDAANDAFGAVLYVRSTDINGKITCSLLQAKSKVAPLKTISIPRKELCGAEILSKMAKRITNICELQNIKIYLWSDSTIVLHWLAKEPIELKTFVQNRVVSINHHTRDAMWSHVASADNPADLISRGVKAGDLINSKLWKNGPQWLTLPENSWPTPKLVLTPQAMSQMRAECKPSGIRINLIRQPFTSRPGERHLLYTFSSWQKIIRITAYVFRFINNLRAKRTKRRAEGNYLRLAELHEAVIYWVKIVQAQHYKADITIFKTDDDKMPAKSKIAGLKPMLDKDGVLRVSGRLGKAVCAYTQKHPIIIPGRTRLSWLIMQQAHVDTMHGGVQLMMAHIRNEYWITCLRSELKMIISRCPVCLRHKGRTSQQIMADLPASRIRPARPFRSVGVDMAGPFNIKLSRRIIMSTRSRSALDLDLKGYVVVFVCMVTRAVHLDAVMELSADAFLAAFQRFVARRGNPQLICSDNGKNFVLADKELKKAAESWQEASVQRFVNQNGTEWRFITPSASHQGGLWEAAVKQMKHHLRRVMGPHKYTYEAMATLLAGVEACMNSRPICAMSDDADDLTALTPAHFLIGGQLRLPLQDQNIPPPKMALSLYKSMQAQTDAFWKRWTVEYLPLLMARPKWKQAQENLKAGQLVLIKDELLAPTYWPLGRIISTKVSDDGRVRTATVKTITGQYDRPVQKLVFLPVDEELSYWR